MNDRPPVTSVDHIDFRAAFPFGSLLRAIGSALRPARLGVAILTLSLLVGGGRIWDGLSTPSPAADTSAPVMGPFALMMTHLEAQGEAVTHAALALDATGVVHSVIALGWGTPATLWEGGYFWFLLIYGCWVAMVMALGGGILCRLEAVEVSQGSAAPISDAVNMVSRHWWSFTVGLLVPFIVAGMLGALLLLFGLVFLNIPVLNIIGGLLYGLALLAGLGMTLLILGGLVAWPLFLPALVVENCDASDAMSRSFSYVINRPLRWMLYVATATIGLALGLLLIATIMHYTVEITACVTSTWTFNDAHLAAKTMHANGDLSEISWWSTATGWCMAFWTTLTTWVIAGWSLAYVMAVSTRAYLLLRHAVDEQDPTEIWWPGLLRGTLSPAPPTDDD